MLEGILSSLKTALVPGTLFVAQKKIQKSKRRKMTRKFKSSKRRQTKRIRKRK